MLERLIPSTPRGKTIALITGASAAIALQLILVRSLHELRIFPKYWTLADDLLGGVLSHDRLNDVSPLYLWCMTIFRQLHLSPFALRVVQFLANGTAIVLSGAIAYRLAGTTAAVATTLALVANKAMFINATELEPETFVLLLNTVALFLLLARPRSVRNTLAGSVVFGLSAITRPVVLPGAVLVLLTRLRKPDEPEGSSRRVTIVASALGIAVPLIAAMALTWMLTGSPSIMNPGTVFYEGMNPHATGYTSTEPLIVSDVRAEVDEPDPLHYAYRLVASRVTGGPLSPESSNRYWTGKAIEFMRVQPALAFRLVLRKLGFAFHSYEAWDVAAMVRRDREVGHLPWIPFGLLVGLAAIAIVERRRDPSVVALALFSMSYVAVMTLFYMSSRQRNAIVSTVAILAGLGVARIVAIVRRDRRRAILWILSASIAAVALSIQGPWQRESAYSWTASFRSEALVQHREEAEAEGNVDEAARMRAIDRTWLLGDDPHIPSAPRDLVAVIARGELSRVESPERLFDLALALQYAGDWPLSDTILESLEQQNYIPIRQTYSVDSIAWYRALVALHSGDPDLARTRFQVAWHDDPADPNVLAMRSLVEDDPSALEDLVLLHDPFTAELALARAQLELGNMEEARSSAASVASRIPEWNRARLLSTYLSDLTGRHRAVTTQGLN